MLFCVGFSVQSGRGNVTLLHSRDGVRATQGYIIPLMEFNPIFGHRKVGLNNAKRKNKDNVGIFIAKIYNADTPGCRKVSCNFT